MRADFLNAVRLLRMGLATKEGRGEVASPIALLPIGWLAICAILSLDRVS